VRGWGGGCGGEGHGRLGGGKLGGREEAREEAARRSLDPPLYKILPVTRRSPCSRRRPDSALRKVVLPAPGGARTRVKRPGRSTPEAPSTIFRGCWETVPSADCRGGGARCREQVRQAHFSSGGACCFPRSSDQPKNVSSPPPPPPNTTHTHLDDVLHGAHDGGDLLVAHRRHGLHAEVLIAHLNRRLRHAHPAGTRTDPTSAAA
jgi:hypothetical protein